MAVVLAFILESSSRCGSGWVGWPARAEDGLAPSLIVSVDERRYTLQMEGIAEALEDPAVLAAIAGDPGGIDFSLVTWADTAQVAVEWRRIASKADALVRVVPACRAPSPASAA